MVVSAQAVQGFEMIVFAFGGTLTVTAPTFVGCKIAEASDSTTSTYELVLYKLDDQGRQDEARVRGGHQRGGAQGLGEALTCREHLREG